MEKDCPFCGAKEPQEKNKVNRFKARHFANCNKVKTFMPLGTKSVEETDAEYRKLVTGLLRVVVNGKTL